MVIFWKVVEPLFHDKVTTNDKTALIANNVIYDNDEKIADIFSTFFSDAVSNLDIEYNGTFKRSCDELDPIMNAIKKYEEHPSINNIKERMNGVNSFNFSHVKIQDIIKELYFLDENKAIPKDSIPPKIIKENCDIFAHKLLVDFNPSVDYSVGYFLII